MREYWINEYENDVHEVGTPFYGGKSGRDESPVIHVREVSPALDEAWLECERALEMLYKAGFEISGGVLPEYHAEEWELDEALGVAEKARAALKKAKEG